MGSGGSSYRYPLIIRWFEVRILPGPLLFHPFSLELFIAISSTLPDSLPIVRQNWLKLRDRRDCVFTAPRFASNLGEVIGTPVDTLSRLAATGWLSESPLLLSNLILDFRCQFALVPVRTCHWFRLLSGLRRATKHVTRDADIACRLRCNSGEGYYPLPTQEPSTQVQPQGQPND
jgi:hypothetical protein